MTTRSSRLFRPILGALLLSVVWLTALVSAQVSTLITSGATLPATCTTGNIFVKTGGSDGFYFCIANVWIGPVTGAGSGDVVGPGSATDNALVRFDSTTGKLIQDGVITESDTGALALPDGIRQTFNPDGTTPGFNVGSEAGDPVTPTNGDCWYNSASNAFKCRIGGVSVSLGAGSGDVVGPGSATDEAYARFDGATGKLIQNGVILESDTGVWTLPDDIRQTFNPGANASGLNAGAIAGDPGTPVNGDLWYDSTANELTARINGANVALGSGGSGTGFGHIGAVFDGGGADITTGSSKLIRFPQVAGTIIRVTLAADVACDAVVDVWSTTFSTASYPDNSDSITGGNEPELTADLAFEDATLTSWTTPFGAGDSAIFTIDSTSGCGSLVVILDYSYGT